MSVARSCAPALVGRAGVAVASCACVAKFTDPYKLVGARIADKYTIEAVIDRGGYGLVYRAFHEILRVPVALKFFTGLASAEEEQQGALLERFAQEGALLTSLSTRSANIVQARDIGTLTTEDGTWMPYLVLEWLEGQSLERLLHSSESPERGQTRGWLEVFNLLDGVARALATAHAAGVAHRDIKPGNFFVLGDALTPGVVVKLLDFGIAKVMPTDLAQTVGGASEFTPKYGAPEQFDRQHGATGPWSDVFGFALVMLELLRGGTRVFTQKDFMGLALACQDPLRRPTPRALGLEASDAVEAVFAKAGGGKVAGRHGHMGGFWNALGAALEVRDFVPVSTDTRWLMPSPGDSRPGVSLRGRVADVSLMAAGSGPRRAELSAFLAGASRSDASPDPATRSDALPTPPGEPVDENAEIFTNMPGTGKPLPLRPPPAPPRRTLWLIAGPAIVAAGAVGAGLVLWKGAPARPPAPRLGAASAEAPKPATPEPAAAAARCPEGTVLIPGGKFFMGSDNVDNKALVPSRPAHQVEVADFCMDLREVTVADYDACSAKGECKRAFRDSLWPQGSMAKKAWEDARAAYSPLCNEGVAGREQHPVNCVTWAQAEAYCLKHGKRLPSEAEWEFAARGSDGRSYPWGDDPPDARHLNGCGQECTAWRAAAGLAASGQLYDADDGFPGTAPVGSFPAGKTQAGLLDMVGNVFEWTADDYALYPGAPADARPPDPGAKVIRGGAFNSAQAEHAEPALRFPQDQTAHVHAVGFRCAQTPK